MKFPRNYTGIWLYETDTYKITRPNEFHFKAENISDSYNKDIYEGFLSKLDKDIFVNSRSITTNQYLFFKLVAIDDNNFELRGVSSYITDTFPSQSDMKDYFIRYKNLSFFFEKEPIKFTRVVPN